MDRNTNLSKDLQRLRHATAVIETVQSGQNLESVSEFFKNIFPFTWRISIVLIFDFIPMQSDSKYREELKLTSAMEQTNDKTHRNDDLIELLNEAKLTILELQREIESLKSETEQLRQQNRTLATQIDSPKNQPEIISRGKELKPSENDKPIAIPLDPIVIVNDNKIDISTNTNQKRDEKNNGIPQAKMNHSKSKLATKNGRDQMPSDQTSQSDNTYVL